MTSLNGIYFRRFARFWANLRSFFYAHKTVFDFLFLFLYIFEEAIVFFLVILMPDKAIHIFTLFILIFSGTFGAERLCMQSRYAKLSVDLSTMTTEYRFLKKECSTLWSLLKMRRGGKK